MKSGWQIGSIFGIPLLLDPSWFFILIGVTYAYATTWLDLEWGQWVAWIAGLIMALSLFSSVLLHELGHSLVAQSQGIKVNSITLFLFGGVASLNEESKTPGQAFQVAIAGPSVSFILFILFSIAGQLFVGNAPVTAVVNNLAAINLVLALFNMLPGLPLDGGQVLKAAIWKLTGSRIQGVRWAARAGQLMGWTALIVGVVLFFQTKVFSFFWIALLGWFGIRNANAYSRITDLQEVLMRINAAAAMTRDFKVVDANWSIRQFADHYLTADVAIAVYYAASDGRYRGLIPLEELRAVDHDLWEKTLLQDIAQPLEEIPAVRENTPISDVIEQMEQAELRRITVLSPAGSVSGVIDRGDIVRAIAEAMNVRISDGVIRQIKDQGTYPPELPLREIAKQSKNQGEPD